VEIDHTRGSDYRRVMVRNAAEEKWFGEIIDPSKWVRDDQYQLAGRPCGLDEIVNERRGTLHRLLDEEFQQNPTMAEAENVNAEALPDNADAESASEKREPK
jgi:hypothetical protein